MILTGLSGVVLIEIYAAVMQREFQNTENNVGKGFAVLGIYLFVVTYCTSLLFSTSFPLPSVAPWRHVSSHENKLTLSIAHH
jgi:hypothetical protein